jgi:hypothetical protein
VSAMGFFLVGLATDVRITPLLLLLMLVGLGCALITPPPDQA